jgi:hypothetical protein
MVVAVLGHFRQRCPESGCEQARQRRRRLQAESAKRIERGEPQPAPERRSVEQLCRHFTSWDGAGFQECLRGVRQLRAEGATLDECSEWSGFSVAELRAAIERAEREEALALGRDAVTPPVQERRAA